MPAFVCLVAIADVCESVEHVSESACADPAKVRFELREGHLNGARIGAVGRQKQNLACSVRLGLGGSGIFMRGRLSRMTTVSGSGSGTSYLLDISGEDGCIHRVPDNPQRDQSLSVEACDKGLRTP